MAVDVKLAGVLHHGAGLVGLPLRGGDVHLLQDRLQKINSHYSTSIMGFSFREGRQRECKVLRNNTSRACNVVDPHHFDADPTYHLNAESDPGFI
jgi:hypothetical protein